MEQNEFELIDDRGLPLTLELELTDTEGGTIPESTFRFANIQSLKAKRLGISLLPENLGTLTELKTLDLRENHLKSLPPQIVNLEKLEEILLDRNFFEKLPDQLLELKKLRYISIEHNRLTYLPDAINRLRKLKHLYIGGNLFDAVPAQVTTLPYLQNLSLSENQIEFLPPEITKLINLKGLFVRGNRLTRFPTEILGLASLEKLSLSDNAIKEISEQIGHLRNLEGLFIRNNLLSELPSELFTLSNLKRLYLERNRIAQLPSGIGKLSNLEQLLLAGNLIDQLPQEITRLSKLKELSISKNPFASFPYEIYELPNLQHLLIDENQLYNFANHLFVLKHLQYSVWNGDRYIPLQTEVVARLESPEELLHYYAQLRFGSRELNEAKVLVVGQGSVGKTSLIKRLISGAYNPQENKTDGIEINKEWKLRVNDRIVQLNIWDFGGQEIMHATHQFFLTKRSLYILVLDSRLDPEENRVDYWLEKIKSLGGDSPVLVVGNKIDQHPLDVNQTGLSRKYPNIVGFYAVSCASEKNLGRLREGVADAVGRIYGLHDAIPTSWFRVKSDLEKLDKDFMPYESYLELCDRNQVDEGDRAKLIRLLHDLGIVLNFRDDPRLSDTNVLNPEWVTQGVYKILNSRELFKSRGILKLRSLSNILDTRIYPKTKHIFVIDMMRKFELCFDIRQDEEFLVPDLLAEEENFTGDWKDSLKFQYHYNVFFNSIITRFIVKMHEYIYKNTYWRTGVVLAYKSGDMVINRALVKADPAERKVYIFVDGNQNTRREFLSRIREKFDEIHQSFADEYVRDNIHQKVPVPNNPEFVVDYEHLLRLESVGKRYVIPEGMVDEVDIRELLNGIESNEERQIRKEDLVRTQTIPLIQSEPSTRLAALEPIKSRIDGTVDAIWFFTKLVFVLGVFVAIYFAVVQIVENWEPIKQNLEAAHIVSIVIVAIVAYLIIFLVGGKEELRLVSNRLDKLRDETMKSLAYKFKGFDFDEYQRIHRELRKITEDD